MEKAADLGIKIHLLPSHSPNLNPIERCWKVMNEKIRNNVFFNSAKEFTNAITDFFECTWEKIKAGLFGRINDNFQHINPVF